MIQTTSTRKRSNAASAARKINADCQLGAAVLPMLQAAAAIMPMTAGRIPRMTDFTSGEFFTRPRKCALASISSAGGRKMPIVAAVAPISPDTL